MGFQIRAIIIVDSGNIERKVINNVFKEYDGGRVNCYDN